MVRLLLLFLSFPVFANLDLTLPQEFDYEQMKKDAIMIKDWEDRNKLRFFEARPRPTQIQIRYSWIVNSLDLATTIYALETMDNVREGNFILGEKPSTEEVIA